MVVDACLEDPDRWYLASTAGRPAGLSHAYLEGENRPMHFTQDGFEIDGVQYKIRLDFAASFMGWRSWYMNPGNQP